MAYTPSGPGRGGSAGSARSGSGQRDAAKRRAANRATSGAGINTGGSSSSGRSYSPRPTPTPSPSPTPNQSGQYSAPSPPPSTSGGGGQVPSQPSPPSVGEFLGQDAGYQRQVKDIERALSDFKSDIGERRGELKTDYKTSERALERQREEDLERIADDFASRGIMRSGLYPEAQGDYETEYGQRTDRLERGHSRAMSSLERELNRFQGEQRSRKQEARSQAVRRRAQEYGL